MTGTEKPRPVKIRALPGMVESPRLEGDPGWTVSDRGDDWTLYRERGWWERFTDWVAGLWPSRDVCGVRTVLGGFTINDAHVEAVCDQAPGHGDLHEGPTLLVSPRMRVAWYDEGGGSGW